jgi:pimeloyl-ACP methyl ester carboxylesterase
VADASRDVITRQVSTAMGRLQVSDHAGDEPARVLMHGFLDDSKIYNRLVPLLSPRRAVAFDFLGCGGSDRPQAGAANPAGHLHQFGAVLDELGIGTAVLVGRDASGPVAIDYALTAPGRVGQLILLNTYYGPAPALRLPEMIRLLAVLDMTPLADAMLDHPDQRMWLLAHTARQFGIDPLDPDSVGLGFGALDRYLSPDLAARLARLFPRADTHLVDGASHWPQWDRPKAVAELIR